ncbi:MAG: ABC transporter permease [Bacteroidota bacterium]|nr:ABC transporter permease [Bacteroidota bacterium]MDP4258793.1 ABC transporter permease [Bacteroidota bacterium]
MISNFLIIAWRNLSKHRVFSFINIFGLAIGIAASLLIFQYARFELSYDRFEPKGDRVFRLEQDRFNNGKLSTQWAAGAAGIGKLVKDNLPEVESYAHLHGTNGLVVNYKDKEFRENNTVFFANDAFLPMFGYTAQKGMQAESLKDVNTAVMTASAARRYFGSEDPIGKVISMNKKKDFRVTAVVSDPPPNTHFHFDILLSFATFIQMNGPGAETAWGWDGFYTYLLLRPGTDPAAFEKKMADLVHSQWGPQMKDTKEGIAFHLQPLRDIHLYSNYMFESETNGNGRAVYFLLVIALFIIVIAWINYINLSTARSVDRAREVGVRKVLGSYRTQLVGQFVFESLLINALAVILGLLLVIGCLPVFNVITGKQISFSLLAEGWFWLVLTGLFLAGTFFSGFYPALVLSSFKPIAVLKGRLAGTGHGALLRQSLVVFQFAASVVLMVGTFAVYRQLRFMQTLDLGIRVDRTMVLKGPNVIDSTYMAKLSAFKEEMLHEPGIVSMTASTEVPGNKVKWNAGGIRLVGSDPTRVQQYRVLGVDYDFMKTYGFHFLKGRDFSKEFRSDSAAVIFNEAAVRQLGFGQPGEALNKRIEFWGKQYTIVGVVSNHHQESPQAAYDAHIFRLIPEVTDYYSIRFHGDENHSEAVMQAAKRQWAAFFPGNPFDYFYLDDHYAQQYKADEQFGKTFGVFAVLAIFISCMGLLGLASFVTIQRTKEIGIRKIIGAGTPGILLLLTRDFVKPVLLSFVLAVPVTWWLLHRWLENYASRIAVSPWMFVLPALLILVIAMGTIATQTLKAASANPSRSLRSE